MILINLLISSIFLVWRTYARLDRLDYDVDGLRNLMYLHQIIDPHNNVTMKLLEDFKSNKAILKTHDLEMEQYYSYIRENCTNVLKKTFNHNCRAAMSQIVDMLPQKKRETLEKIQDALGTYMDIVREKENKRQEGWKGMWTHLREAAEKVYIYYRSYDIYSENDLEHGPIYRYAKCEMNFWKRLMGRCAAIHLQ